MPNGYGDVGRWYRDAPWQERLYARVRYMTAPLEAVASLIPPGAKTLVEFGCSTGVFANVAKTRRPDLDVTGVDHDPRKIEAASRTVGGREGLRFVTAAAEDYVRAHPPPDVVAVVDVLYLWPPATQDDFLKRAANWLAPGGTLLVKEMTDRPWYKRRFCLLQEWLAVKVIGLTKGQGVFLRPAAAYRRTLAAAGLDTQSFDLGRGYLHPHFAWRATK